jgi:uncharacterized protein (TIGR01777 family)
LINLSGKSVNCRYTKKNKAEIYRSRLEPTNLLGSVIAELKHPPKTWINAASATIYRNAEDRPQDEEKGEIGEGFSVDVCQQWEKSFWSVPTPHTKKILLRISMVLGMADGIMPRVKNLAKLGMGGRQGSGHQYISWIHEEDLARITEFVHQEGSDGAVFNCSAPEVVTNSHFMKLVRNCYGSQIGLPTPAWLLKIGALVIGTETELILKSRWVYPLNLLKKGFNFRFSRAEEAIKDILGCS